MDGDALVVAGVSVISMSSSSGLSPSWACLMVLPGFGAVFGLGLSVLLLLDLHPVSKYVQIALGQ